tara:strand:+ start:996 stop:2471 length:1476 start_codon:yes stop_codon:yes gene_type:complete
MTDFSHIAACCREAYNGVKRPALVLESAFNLAIDEVSELIGFFHRDTRMTGKLTDEDLREIFFLLTDVYPEEVDDNPDLVQILANLSPAKRTNTTFKFAYRQMGRILGPDVSNEGKAMHLQALAKLMAKKDMYWFLLRLTGRGTPFKSRDVVEALAAHFDIPVARVKRQAIFTSLPVLANQLKSRTVTFGMPSVGDKLLIPIPHRVSNLEELPYPSNHVELIQGERLSLHHSISEPHSLTVLMDANGVVIESKESPVLKEFIDEIKSNDQYSIPFGIYTIERDKDDNFCFVDILLHIDSDIHNKAWVERQQWMQLNISPHLIKPKNEVMNIIQLQQYAPKNAICFIYNGDAVQTYTNSREEVILYSTKSEGSVLKVVHGVWQYVEGRGLVLGGWQVAARDGVDGYYNVGILAADPLTQRKLVALTKDGKAVEGEIIEMKGPTFVDVDIHFANFDENRGIIIQGLIIGICSDAGLSDVAPVEQLEWMVGDEA